MQVKPISPPTSSTAQYDLLVVGGGINGAGIARDAAGRGLSTLLCEKGDLASATSSASSKLIHGGLRYLEQFEFRLVRESLSEREVLLNIAPHIIWPLRFVLPHHRDLRPAWMLRTGLFLYDHLGRRKLLPPTRSLDLRISVAGRALKSDFARAFEYSDLWVDDARLVVLNAISASEHGASIRTRTEFVSAERAGNRWTVTLKPRNAGTYTVTARALVNSAGPWVSDVQSRIWPARNRAPTVRLVKGSHLITRKLYDGDHAYIFQNADKRILFAIPYENNFTLLGTTEHPFENLADPVTASGEEIDYILEMASAYFRKPVTRDDICRTYAGVRPLFEESAGKNVSQITRDYVFDLETPDGAAPLLSVFGGKITTYRKLAEQALEKLAPLLGATGEAWTGASCLPGGDIGPGGFVDFVEEMCNAYPWAEKKLVRRLARAYGTRLHQILTGATAPAHLGRHFGQGLTEREVRYLIGQEWARTADDILWRRSKLGLHLVSDQIAALEAWIGAEAEPTDAPAGRSVPSTRRQQP